MPSTHGVIMNKGLPVMIRFSEQASLEQIEFVEHEQSPHVILLLKPRDYMWLLLNERV